MELNITFKMKFAFTHNYTQRICCYISKYFHWFWSYRKRKKIVKVINFSKFVLPTLFKFLLNVKNNDLNKFEKLQVI